MAIKVYFDHVHGNPVLDGARCTVCGAVLISPDETDLHEFRSEHEACQQPSAA